MRYLVPFSILVLFSVPAFAGVSASDCNNQNFGVQTPEKFCTGDGRAWLLTDPADRFDTGSGGQMDISYVDEIELNIRQEAPNNEEVESFMIVSGLFFENEELAPNEKFGPFPVTTGDNIFTVPRDQLELMLGWQERDGVLVGLETTRFFQGFFAIKLGPVVQALDWGDAPEAPQGAYPTTRQNNGARHSIIANFSLKDITLPQPDPDPELDGQPSPEADDDDSNGTDDENGWLFPVAPLAAPFPIVLVGSSIDLEVFADIRGVPGVQSFLQVFMDTDRSNFWDPGEQLVSDAVVAQGLNLVPVDIPLGTSLGFTFARFRLSTMQGLGQGGLAPDGEVEDYRFLLTDTDFGDAPASYDAIGEAVHLIYPGLSIGSGVDGEDFSFPGPRADGDDLSGVVVGDEDGLVDLRPLSLMTLPGRMNFVFPGEMARLTFKLGGNRGGTFAAWLDLDASDAFEDPAERIVGPAVFGPIMVSRTFMVPADADLGLTYLRMRLSDNIFPPFGALGPTDFGGFGEVEDHATFVAFGLDWGDAPESYGTLADDNGPRHAILADFGLGDRNDAEPDGQPTVDVDGDDFNGQEDEDGVLFRGLPGDNLLRTNRNDTVIVSTASLQVGELHAWVDANRDGDFDDPGEKVIDALQLTEQVTEVAVDVPDAIAESGDSVMRFRYIMPPRPQDPPLEPIDDEDSVLHVGEVEDHPVSLYFEVFAGNFEEDG